jgi:hypothetical protein
MRLVTHLLLALLFAAPVGVAVWVARFAAAGRAESRVLRMMPGLGQIARGRTRQGSAVFAALLFAAEIWIASRFLGLLMVITLLLLIAAMLIYGFAGGVARPGIPGARSERLALGLLFVGVAASAALYVGYKNRPSYFMDPSRADARFPMGQVAVPSALPAPLAQPDRIQAALTMYGNAFTRLLEGYYILDRNYNYDFHNRLFLRRTPLVPVYRGLGLRAVGEASSLRAAADHALRASAPPPPTDALGALLEDVRTFAAFTFDRAPLLEQMSARFESTEAGLQHATHLYEGEGKVLSADLGALLDKHRAALAVPAVASVAAGFVTSSRAVREAYANRIVGF